MQYANRKKYLNLFNGKDDSFTLRLELLSPLIIDKIQSCVFTDKAGSIYIPATTIKGALRESALEVIKMFENSQLDCVSIDDINTLFGTSNSSSLIIFSDCYLRNSEKNFTEITYMKIFCSIDRLGTVNNNKFYRLELLKENTVFLGKIKFTNKIEYKLLILLILAIKTLRKIGGDFHKGYGLTKCDLIDERGMILCEKYLDNFEM